MSVADILSYQIGWGTLLISWYEAGVKNEMPSMPGEGFTKWDYVGLAEHFYQKFHDVVQTILAIVEQEYANGNLDTLVVWSWCTLASGKMWPLSKLITVNTVAPYKRASGLIRKFLKTLNC